MSKLYLIFLYLSGLSLFGQYNNDFLLYSLNKESINLNSEYEINSNALTNEFLSRFYRGGYINNDMKDRVLKRLDGYNRVGGHFNYNAVCFFRKDSSRYAYTLGFKQQQLFNTSFSSDFFKLGFYGNKMYKGETANLSNSNINLYSYQEIKLGVILNEVDTTHASMGISVSYLRGQNLAQLKTNTSSVYTAGDASQIVLNTNASLALSDTTTKGGALSNGNGASVEFYTEMPYVSRLGKSLFFLSVNNLGFIRWNKNSLYYTTDSIFTYSGIHVSNLFDLKDSTLQSIGMDSIIKNSTSLSRRYISTNLPTSFFITHKIRFSKYFTLNNGFRHLFNANYKPYIFVENEFTLGSRFHLTLHAGYGGYGLLNVGLCGLFQLNKQVCLRIGSNSMQGLVSQKNTLGQGAYFSLSYQLR